MTVDTHTDPLEQSVSIDAAPADVFAVLTAVEPVFEACAGLTVSTDEEGVTVTDAGADASPSAFDGQVRVTECEEPTSLTMIFDGEIESTVEWTLQPEEPHTLVTATVTNGLPADRDGTTGGGRAEATGGDSSASDLSPTVPLTDVLETLQTLCEQPSPPACIVSRLEIPDLNYSGTTKIHPHFDATADQTLQWAHKFGAMELANPPPELEEVLRLPGRGHPHASREVLQLCVDWTGWIFTYDDRIDNTEQGTDPTVVERIQKPYRAVLADGAQAPFEDPMVRLFADLWQRAGDLMTPVLQDRWARHHREYFDAVQWETNNRNAGRVPELSTFIEHRPLLGCTAGVFALVELARDCVLPVYISQRADYTAILKATGNVIMWTNDVYSLHKDLEDNTVHNLVLVLRNEQGCSTQTAMTEACAMIESEVARIDKNAQALTAETDIDVSPYISGVEQWMAANLSWTKETVRYGHSE